MCQFSGAQGGVYRLEGPLVARSRRVRQDVQYGSL
jgi:hypothetical protein